MGNIRKLKAVAINGGLGEISLKNKPENPANRENGGRNIINIFAEL